MMRHPVPIIALLLIVGLIITVVTQRRIIGELRQQNVDLQAQFAEADRLRHENTNIETLRAEAEEVERLRVANRDLARLRNQVRELREDLLSPNPRPPAGE